MIKASELRTRLKKGGFDAEAAETIIKGEIDAGRAEDDGVGGMIPVDMLIEASAALRDLPDLGEPERAELAKGAALPEEASDLMRAAAVNTENLVDYQREALPAIAKGVMAHGVVIESLTSALAQLQTLVKGIDERLSAPVPPRGLTGAKPLPHPGERTIEKSEKPAATAPALSRAQLHTALRERQTEIIRKGAAVSHEEAAELDSIGRAIGALESSTAPVTKILRDFEIAVN